MTMASISADRVPRTERGRKTLRKLLDAAAREFAENGFYDASISAITRRAGVALGTFYIYYESKDAIFRALVTDMSERVGAAARDALAPGMDALEIERAALEAFLGFAAENKGLYRIIDEAEFVDPASFHAHYATTAERIEQRLKAAAARGEVRPDISDIHAWAVMGMNVFLGLRYGVWDEDRTPESVADTVAELLRDGLRAR